MYELNKAGAELDRWVDDLLDDIKHSDEMSHSYKGSEWKDHKYIKKEDGRYYYPKESAASGAYDNDIEFKKDKIEELYNIKIHHTEALQKAIESGDTASADKYKEYIKNIDAQMAALQEEVENLSSHAHPNFKTPDNARRLNHSELMHYGVGPDDNPPGRGSGRYPKGSGERPFQHDPSHDAGEKKKGLFSIFKKKDHDEAFLKEQKEEKLREAKAKQLLQAIKSNVNPDKPWDVDKLSNTKEIRELAENENIKAARKAYEEADSEYPNYSKDDKVREYYMRMAANVKNAVLLSKGYTDLADSFENIEELEDWYVHDDGDQGSFNSFQCYLIDHNIDLEDYSKRTLETHQKYNDVCDREINLVLGKDARKLIGDTDFNRTYGEIVSDAVEEHQEDLGGHYFGWYDSHYYSKMGDSMDVAKKAMADYKNSHPLKHSDDLLDDFLAHYGVGPDDNPPGRGSGRYPKGTGDRPFQHDPEEMAKRKRGLFGGIKSALAKRKANTEIDRYRDYVQGMLSGSLKNNKALHEKYNELSRADYDGDRPKLAEEWKKFSEEVVDKHAKAEARNAALEKARETKAANKAKAEKEQRSKEERDAAKAKAIASGDPEQISKWLSEMSNQEQFDALNRIRQTKDIKSQAAAQVKAREDAAKAEEATRRAEEEANRPKTAKELRDEKLKTGFETAKNVMNKVDDVRQMAEKGIKFWNVIAAVNNATNPDFKLPKVDLNTGDKKKDNKNEEKNEDKNKEKNKNKDQQNNSGATTNSNNTTYNTTNNTTNNYYNDSRTETGDKESDRRATTDRSNDTVHDWYDVSNKYEKGRNLLEDFMRRTK